MKTNNCMKKWREEEKRKGLRTRSYNLPEYIVRNLNKIAKETNIRKSEIVTKALYNYITAYNDGTIKITMNNNDEKIKSLEIKIDNFLKAYFFNDYDMEEIMVMNRIISSNISSDEDIKSKKFFDKISDKLNKFIMNPESGLDSSDIFESHEKYLCFLEAFYFKKIP